MRRRTRVIGEILGWVGIGLVLLAAIFLQDGRSRDWNAAIMWTFTAFFGAVVFGAKLRGSWRFWAFLLVSLGIHIFAMWVVFAHWFPSLRVGAWMGFPIGFFEALLLVRAFGAFQRMTRPAPESPDPSGN